MTKPRNKVQPGYPKKFVFESREAVDAYLSGDVIDCLICGNHFRSLEPHLSRSHDISADEYREKYGLPYRRGLCCDGFSKARSERAKRTFEENVDRQMSALAKAKAVQQKLGNPQRCKPVFWKKERTRFGPEHYEEFIKRVVSGRSVSDVSNDPDVPHSTHVYLYMKKNKGFAERYRAIIPLFAPTGRRRQKTKDAA